MFKDTTDFDPGAGIYNLNSKGNSDIFVIKLNQTTIGIKENINSFIFSIYPNPSGNIINLSCTGLKCDQLLVSVKNNLSQIVYSTSAPNITKEYKTSIDLSAQPKGIYFIEVIADGKREVRKVVLQ